MKNFVVLFLVAIFFISCQGHDFNNKTSNIYLKHQDSIFNLIDNALNNGDFKAYNSAAHYYFIKDKSEDFLFVAITMANKYNNSEACYHVYKILNGTRNQEKIEKLDEKTKAMALFYLLKSYEMGYAQSKYEVCQIFDTLKYLPKSSFYLNK